MLRNLGKTCFDHEASLSPQLVACVFIPFSVLKVMTNLSQGLYCSLLSVQHFILKSQCTEKTKENKYGWIVCRWKLSPIFSLGPCLHSTKRKHFKLNWVLTEALTFNFTAWMLPHRLKRNEDVSSYIYPPHWPPLSACASCLKDQSGYSKLTVRPSSVFISYQHCF